MSWICSSSSRNWIFCKFLLHKLSRKHMIQWVGTVFFFRVKRVERRKEKIVFNNRESSNFAVNLFPTSFWWTNRIYLSLDLLQKLVEYFWFFVKSYAIYSFCSKNYFCSLANWQFRRSDCAWLQHRADKRFWVASARIGEL